MEEEGGRGMISMRVVNGARGVDCVGRWGESDGHKRMFRRTERCSPSFFTHLARPIIFCYVMLFQLNEGCLERFAFSVSLRY